MVVFPNAKINLGLNIIGKRADGYHELETCFFPVMWQEVLEIVESKKTAISLSGMEIPGGGENIVLKAYQSLKSDFDLPPVRIHLHKTIPIGAGLGGGSADAAFTLKLLNDLFGLKLNDTELMRHAVLLGADCTFFIKNRPMLASGIGEKLQEVEIPLQGKFVLMVYPNIHISTREAYSGITPKKPDLGIRKILYTKDVIQWKGCLKNDFEKTLFTKYPTLKEIKKEFYEQGAIYASMSGSGSCLYGFFDQDPKLIFPKTYSVWQGRV